MASSVATILAIALAVTVAPSAEFAPQQRAGVLTVASGQQAAVKVDLNSANTSELQTVPGIGEAIAIRIVEFRQQHGVFERVDDLLDVRGIGVQSLEKLRPYLTVKTQDQDS